MSPQVVLLDESNFVLCAFRFSLITYIGGYTFDAVQEEQDSDHSSTEAFFVSHECPQVVHLDESDIAIFVFKITFDIKGEIP